MTVQMFFVPIVIFLIISRHKAVSDQCPQEVVESTDQMVDRLTKTRQEFIKVDTLHSSLYQRHLHNVTRYEQYMFQKTFTHSGSRYLLSRYATGHFHTATVACALYGATVAQIKNDEDLRVIRDFLKINAKSKTVCAFIGINKHNDGSWYYTDSKTLAYMKFGHGQPSSAEGETCASLHSAHNWYMGDQLCYTKVFCEILCQRPLK